MTEPAPDARSPSLEAVRALEQRLAERMSSRAAAEAAVEAARLEAERIRAVARSRGEAAAARRRRDALAAADVEAEAIRSGAVGSAAALVAALAARLDETVAELEAVVLPGSRPE